MKVESVSREASAAATVVVGGSSYIIDLSQLEALGLPPSTLVPGAELDEGELDILSLAAEAREAERRGLALVARAEQSSFMLGLKLEARGFSKKAVRLALERLAARKFLDDRRFAVAYVATRLARRSSKPEGPASFSAALRERGVDRSTAEEAIAEVLGPEERATALAAAAGKLFGRIKPDGRGSGDARDEVRRRLRTLGFGSNEIADFFEG